MILNIILRMCDKVDSVNGLKRPFGLTKQQVIFSCYKSLIDSLVTIQDKYSLTIVGDDVSQETIDFIQKNAPSNFKLINNTPALGNQGSLLKAYEIADSLPDEENSWVYFLEDDYLHHVPWFLARLLDFWNFCNQYQFALPIFIHPSDYPDQYNRLLSRCYLFQCPLGYWREVSSTTGTYICEVKTYKKFSSYIRECNSDDGKFSEIFKKSALCFSPQPGLSTHFHIGTMSNYVDWNNYLIK